MKYEPVKHILCRNCGGFENMHCPNCNGCITHKGGGQYMCTDCGKRLYENKDGTYS